MPLRQRGSGSRVVPHSRRCYGHAGKAKECAAQVSKRRGRNADANGEPDGLGRGLHARRLPASAVNSGGSAAVPHKLRGL
jgi:hypothetical protein